MSAIPAAPIPPAQRDEIEAILREINADPKAKLLRVPSADNLLALADQPQVGVYAPSLTAAERHLLQTHREELAYLLRERCYMEFYAQPDADVKWFRSQSSAQDAPVDRHGDWRERVVSSLDFDDERASDAVRVLSEVVDSRPTGSRGVLKSLAGAAVRVAPSNRSRLYLANEAIDRGDLCAATQVCEFVIANESSRSLLSYAWHAQGLIHQMEDRREDAVASMECASLLTERPRTAVAWLVSATLAGNERAQACAAARMRSLSGVGHSSRIQAEGALARFSSTHEDAVAALERFRDAIAS